MRVNNHDLQCIICDACTQQWTYLGCITNNTTSRVIAALGCSREQNYRKTAGVNVVTVQVFYAYFLITFCVPKKWHPDSASKTLSLKPRTHMGTSVPCRSTFLHFEIEIMVNINSLLITKLVISVGSSLYVVCFLLGNSPASGVYMPTFRNTVCSIFIGR